ncbi:hypothetical protein KAFR_0E03870 [Kazachstania africana CBS 2517]|uniref:Ubiquitin-like domain-containing protein n=1 Tax=Kazachstania africana (strain ATCC 22294 / BCRC 22015 / CBS 2517 / CECT 1963 / NBRC 1671 / NRRL Y-8276) TaxID=1071382 RepID=H2AVY8_KAZAF|nr:hypothetical protein KAFR_0E03870 [Kazachstania africana CBS 2517]CCF58538.1 hypothetical protein KAFR_0E03870 [Kazachstania africana CBS 2517]
MSDSSSSSDDFFLAASEEDDEPLSYGNARETIIDEKVTETIRSDESSDDSIMKEYVKRNSLRSSKTEPSEGKRGEPRRTSKRTRTSVISSSASDESFFSDGSASRSSSRSPSPPAKRQKSFISETAEDSDENDDFFKELATVAQKKSVTGTESAAKRPKRIYNIRFISKLDGSINKSVKVKVLGKFPFSKILPAALKGLIDAYKIPSIMSEIYDVENVGLYWNNAKLLNFMTCDSLSIPLAFENEISNVDILIVSKEFGEKLEKLDQMKTLQEEAKLERQEEIKDVDEGDDFVLKEFEAELRDVAPSNANLSLDTDGEDSEPLMKLALMGQDNKKIYVNVRSSTQISKLVEYYKKQKNLARNVKVKLLFDHDELDLNETVGDQDMEDEDMIDVVVV